MLGEPECRRGLPFAAKLYDIIATTYLARMRRVFQRLQLQGWHVLHVHADRLWPRGQGAVITLTTWLCYAAALLG